MCAYTTNYEHETKEVRGQGPFNIWFSLMFAGFYHFPLLTILRTLEHLFEIYLSFILTVKGLRYIWFVYLWFIV